jgi:hypothetical protein
MAMIDIGTIAMNASIGSIIAGIGIGIDAEAL